jgi:hypothetical protein
MNRNTRKGLGAILAGVGMTTLLGVMSGTGVVRATTDDGDEGFPQDQPAGDAAPTEAVVTMKERCIWYVSGVASTITLLTDGDEEDTVYDGDQFSLSATLDDYVAWTSGNTSGAGDPDAHAACTFFGDKTGISVAGLWSDNEFTAEAYTAEDIYVPEDTMDFVASGDDLLTMVIAEDECRADVLGAGWSVGTGIVASSPSVSTPILTLLRVDATERPADTAGFNDKCNSDMSVTASIPTGKTPAYAGRPYKFTGPTFTTEIDIAEG